MLPQASTTARACSFPLGTFNLGVGLTGVYFSFDSGESWIQPTYTGLTAADCSPTVEPCVPHVGPIHTAPNFYENGLRSRSDAGVAFGPAPGTNGFSWANGSRLYFSTIATNLTDTPIDRSGIKSNFALTVSHIDDVTPERVQDQSNWSRPYFVPTKISPTAGLDKEQVWADTTPRPAPSSATSTSAIRTSTASTAGTTSRCSPTSPCRRTAASDGRRTA